PFSAQMVAPFIPRFLLCLSPGPPRSSATTPSTFSPFPYDSRPPRYERSSVVVLGVPPTRQPRLFARPLSISETRHSSSLLQRQRARRKHPASASASAALLYPV